MAHVQFTHVVVGLFLCGEASTLRGVMPLAKHHFESFLGVLVLVKNMFGNVFEVLLSFRGTSQLLRHGTVSFSVAKLFSVMREPKPPCAGVALAVFLSMWRFALYPLLFRSKTAVVAMSSDVSNALLLSPLPALSRALSCVAI